MAQDKNSLFIGNTLKVGLIVVGVLLLLRKSKKAKLDRKQGALQGGVANNTSPTTIFKEIPKECPKQEECKECPVTSDCSAKDKIIKEKDVVIENKDSEISKLKEAIQGFRNSRTVYAFNGDADLQDLEDLNIF